MKRDVFVLRRTSWLVLLLRLGLGRMYFTVLPWYLANLKLSLLILLLFVLKECLWCLYYGGKNCYFYLLYFHCLFSCDCTVCQQPRGHFDACFDAMVYCVAQLSLWFSFLIRAGILGGKKKIKLFYNYGYLIESAFVTAAEVLETGVCKYLYIFWFVFNLRDVCACFCSSPLATHASRLAYLHAEWLLPWEDTGLRVTWIACVVQPTPRSLVSL